jgi:hypothetical protein
MSAIAEMAATEAERPVDPQRRQHTTESSPRYM